MKNILIITFFLFGLESVYSQKLDTLESGAGKEGGIRRIRELSGNDEIRKVWVTYWKKNGVIEKSFSQYNSNHIRITQIDSVFDRKNNLIELDRKIGNTIEGDRQEFDINGRLTQRSISLYIGDKLIVFQKFFDSAWYFRSIIDGNPPDYIEINEARFEEAVKIYNDRLLFDKISN